MDTLVSFLSRDNASPITVRFLGIRDRTLKFLPSEYTFKPSSGKHKKDLAVVQWPTAHEISSRDTAQH